MHKFRDFITKCGVHVKITEVMDDCQQCSDAWVMANAIQEHGNNCSRSWRLL